MKAQSPPVTSFADLVCATHPRTQARGSDEMCGLQETQYEQKLLNILKDQGTSYIVWQEIFDNGAKILPDTVIDVWKGGNWQEEMVKVRVPSNPCPFVSVVLRGSCGLAWRRAGRPSVLTAGRLWAVCAGYAGDEGRLQDSPLRSVLPQLHQLCVTSA